MTWYAKIIVAIIITLAAWGLHESFHALPKLVRLLLIRRHDRKEKGK